MRHRERQHLGLRVPVHWLYHYSKPHDFHDYASCISGPHAYVSGPHESGNGIFDLYVCGPGLHAYDSELCAYDSELCAYDSELCAYDSGIHSYDSEIRIEGSGL